ncbi:MAG TPA: hypothetical protein VNQ33_05025 [Acidimicrobiales bacterium]|nr:hypothetical protein [Acidimicrobiales bacterium]
MSILSGARTVVRPLSPEHYETLRRAELTPMLGTVRFGGATPSPADHVRSLWTGVLLQSTAHDPASDELQALLTCYDADLRNGHAWIAIQAGPTAIGNGIAFAGLALFVTDLFAEWRFRHLYAETSTSSFERFRSGEGQLFDVEGTLRDHHLRGSATSDKHLLRIRRDRWMESIGAIVARRRAALERQPRALPRPDHGT